MLICWVAAASVVAALTQLVCLSAAGRWLLLAAFALLVTQLVLVLAFGCAVPNVLATALAAYRDVQGSAGALFGLSYYALIAAGLGLLGALYQPLPIFQPCFMLAVSLLMWPVARVAR